MRDPARRLLQIGVALLLFALVVGLAIPALAVPRLGVAAHVNAVIGAGLRVTRLSEFQTFFKGLQRDRRVPWDFALLAEKPA